MDELKKRREFNFITTTQEEDAKQAVRSGSLAFALIIPSDFSANAVPGLEDGRGRLLVYTSAGNNFERAQFWRSNLPKNWARASTAP